MKRIITLFLALILIFSMIVPAAADLLDSEAPVTDAYTLENFYNGQGTAAQIEELFQQGAKSVQVGDYLLQVDAGTGNFRLVNLTTGKKLDSLPILFTEGIENITEAQSRQDYFSDLIVEYFFNPLIAMQQVSANASGGSGSGNAHASAAQSSTQFFYSFDHSVKLGQFKVSEIKNGFRLEYGINEVDTVIYPLVLSEEQWNKYIARIEDPAVREYAEYIYQPYDIDEIKKERSYWDKMAKKDKGNDVYEANYYEWNQKYANFVQWPGMDSVWKNEGGIYYVHIPSSDKGPTAEDDAFIRECWSVHAKMTQEEYKELCEELHGYTSPYATGGCMIPVELTINDEGVLTYKIVCEEIEAGPGFYVNTVTAARWMCTSFTDDEGYLVVPSGSGAIIDNNTADGVMPKAMYQLGGSDNAKSQSGGIPYRETNVIPVYGVVKGNDAVTAIVESGIPHAVVDVQVDYPLANTSINRIAVQFETCLFDKVKVDGYDTDEQQAFQLFPRRIVDGLVYGLMPNESFSITFRMSEGNDANYSYMASVYRDMLIEKGMTEKLDAAESIPLMLDIFGCIDKSVLVLGMPFETKYALTRFEEAKEIMEYLKTEAGVENFDTRYLGWANGGYFSTAPTKIKVQRQLGGKDGLIDLINYMDDNGYGLYPDVNLVTVYKDEWFDGYNSNKMTSKRIDFVYAILHGTDLVTGKTMSGWFSRFAISPRYYDTVFTKFRSEIDAKLPELKSYAFSESGKTITSDFTINKYVYRGESAKMVENFMKQFEADGYKIATETGSEYMLPYVSNVWRLPQSSSKLLIETEQIPLAQMVLHGSVVYCGEAINETQEDSLYILRCLELGMSPYLESMYTVDDDLKDSEFMDYFSLNYKNWANSVKNIYGEVNEVMKDLQDKTIVSHEILAKNVRKTTYEGGVSVIVNYDKVPYDYNGQTVEARGYVVVG